MRRATCISLVIAAMLCGGLAQAQDNADTADRLVTLEPIRTVTIGENREFIVNGKPFLPIMSWAQNRRNFPLLRQVGINTFCGSTGDGILDAAQAAGGYAIVHLNDYARADHPFMFAWIHRDEPDMPQRSEQAATPDAIEGAEGGRPAARFEPKEPPAVTAERYRKIREADKTKPIFVTFTGHFTTQIRSHYTAEQQAELYPAYIKVTDVVGFDIYPIYGHGRPGWLNRPADAVAELGRLAGPRRPVYAWIEANKGSRWMTYEKQPDVLPKHTRFQVWGALINGATAYGYFTHAWQPTFKEFAPTPEMQAEMRRVNLQVTRLAPAILAAPARQKIAMDMEGELKGQFKATSHDGSLYIFAQNRDLGPNAENLGQFDPISPRGGKATFTVEGLKAGTQIEVIDENRTIVAEDGKFIDQFGPLAEHIYRIRL
jgi:hypothetical protein